MLSGLTGTNSLLGIGTSIKLKRPTLERSNFMNLGQYNDLNTLQKLPSSTQYIFNHNHYGMPYQSQFDNLSLSLFNTAFESSRKIRVKSTSLSCISSSNDSINVSSSGSSFDNPSFRRIPLNQ